ncbi:recombinase family protein [Pantoea sp. ACRSH]|uniref:recombinase family protein n=1 Tax=unclassified Pantoea TaxID=2630326 RepID=UPI001EF58ABF|nr:MULTISPECIES: recombinase family protein [unclassified Pantoea]MCG7366170.1 recombinase family protein [Pantoea sp. ACRSH]MCG7396651.1 recombinase family protein [Pantoea sp. ACRSC]
MKFGYARVSSKEQNEARQMAALSEAGCDEVMLDKLSGKNVERPQLQRMLDKLRSGDQVVVKSVDRLGRNTKDVLSLVDVMIEKGVSVTFLDNAMVFDNTPASRLVLTMMASVAEFERGLINQRQAEGIAAAKAEGRMVGKQIDKKLHAKVAKLLQAGGLTNQAVADAAGCGVATVYRIKKELAAA